MSSSEQAHRRYNAEGRRAQAHATRERILAMARTLFVDHGYAGTSIADIADASGVSAPTVFAGFGSKVNLLRHAVESTFAEVDAVSPVAPAHARSVSETTAEEFLRELAAVIAARAPQLGPVHAVVHGAADADPEIARIAAGLDAQRLTVATEQAATVMRLLEDDDPDRHAEVRDTIWTLGSPQVHTLLVTQRGWSPRRFGTWVERVLTALVL